MENILNMEYSLNTILYLVELQIKEGVQSDFIHYIETYPFCYGVEYRKEVLEYLIKYNNENLHKTLNKHMEICNAIIEKWDNELRFMTSWKQKALNYNIYCTLKKGTIHPFEKISLIRQKRGYRTNRRKRGYRTNRRKKNGMYEYGNCLIENNRYWADVDKDTQKIPLSDNFISKMTSTYSLAIFVNDVRCFLYDYVCEIENLQTVKQPPQITPPDMPIRQFTDKQIELLKSYFVSTFKGLSKFQDVGKTTNYFDDYLLIDLSKNRNGIGYAKIAKLIYESPKLKKEYKEKPFEQWYECFCHLMGVKKCQYRKSTIIIDDAIQREFYYLLT